MSKDPCFKPFTDRMIYGNSNRQGTGPSDMARRELMRQVRALMSVDSGLEQMCLDIHTDGAKLKAEVDRLRAERARLAESIRRGLGL